MARRDDVGDYRGCHPARGMPAHAINDCYQRVGADIELDRSRIAAAQHHTVDHNPILVLGTMLSRVGEHRNSHSACTSRTVMLSLVEKLTVSPSRNSTGTLGSSRWSFLKVPFTEP